MNETYFIEKHAKRFKLETQRIDKYTIRIYSNKYMFDSWIATLEGKKIKLLHLSKRNVRNKCCYHKQREVRAKNWFWILETINSHNEYTITRKWNARENLVDRKLREYKESGQWNKN